MLQISANSSIRVHSKREQSCPRSLRAGLVLRAYLTAAPDPLSPRLSSSSKMGLVTPAHRLLVKFKDKLEFKRIVHCRHNLSVQGYV